MAQDNQLSATVSAQDLTAISEALDAITARLPFLINLTAEERQVYAKMGDKTVAFVEKALEYAREHPNLVPPYLNVAEFERDMALIRQLQAVARPVQSLAEALDDTIMLAGSESYSAALTFYSSVRTAKNLNVPGTKSIYDALRMRFPGRGPAMTVESSESEADTSEAAEPPTT
jgi:hypothetical protein